MHKPGQLVACQPLFFTLRQTYSYGWGKDDNKTTSGIDNIVLTMRWTISQEHDGFSGMKHILTIFFKNKLSQRRQCLKRVGRSNQLISQVKIQIKITALVSKTAANIWRLVDWPKAWNLFSFLENTGDAPRGTPEVQNQPGEVFQSRCIWAIFHLELYLYFFSTGDLPPGAEDEPRGGPDQLPHVWPCRRDLGEVFFGLIWLESFLLFGEHIVGVCWWSQYLLSKTNAFVLSDGNIEWFRLRSKLRAADWIVIELCCRWWSGSLSSTRSKLLEYWPSLSTGSRNEIACAENFQKWAAGIQHQWTTIWIFLISHFTYIMLFVHSSQSSKIVSILIQHSSSSATHLGKQKAIVCCIWVTMFVLASLALILFITRNPHFQIGPIRHQSGTQFRIKCIFEQI